MLNASPTDDGGFQPSYVASGVLTIPLVAREERIPYVGVATQELLDRSRPRVVVIELPDFVANFAREHIVWFYRAVGVVEYVVHCNGLPIHHLVASQDKRKERKQTAIALFREVIGRPPATDDESDAFYNGYRFLKPLLPIDPPSGAWEDDDDPEINPDDDCGG